MKLPRRNFLHLAAGAAALPLAAACRKGASLSDAAGAHHLRDCRRWRARHRRASGGAMVVGAARSAIRRGEPDRAAPPISRPRRSSESPDGYTLLQVISANAINATLYDKLNFNFIRDIAPVASITLTPHIMEVNPSFPAKTVPAFIAYAKANPGKISLASTGIGSPRPFG